MEYQFLLSYNLLDPNYGQLYNKKNRISLVEKPPQLKKMIAAHFNKKTQSKIQELKNIKYIGCVQTLAEFEDDNELVLIYPDVLPYTLNQQKIEQFSNEQKLKIAIQLILAFLEFDKRELYWFINDLNQLYFYDNLLFIGFFDIDFQNYKEQKYSKSQQEQQCKNFIFLYFFNDLLVDCQNDQLNKILNKLVAKLQNNNQQNEIDYFYQKLMNVQRSDDLQEGGNSYVSFYQLNLKNKILQPNWPAMIAIKELKTYKLSSMNYQSDKENYLKNIKREIDILELFNFSQNVSQILAYFRFNESVFFISKKYWGTLQDLVKNEWNKIFLPKKEIYYCLQVAKAYLQLKLKNVIHRDLKPNNIFVEKLEDNSFNICVADFDRSKVIENDDQEQSKSNLQNTPRYDPPETYLNDRYDIWQIGIVLLFIASQGNYEWQFGARSYSTDQEFNDNFGKDKIIDKLKQFQYQQEFIDIIIGCLQKDPKNRLCADEIVNKLQQLLPQKDRKMRILRE